jgi:maleate cis-trans isomerase
VTPFDSEINNRIEAYLSNRQLSVLCSPLFEHQEVGAASKIDSDELFQRVEKILGAHPAADAIYFQGAALDPLPIVDRLEKRCGICVVASNPAMLWHLLSRMGYKYCIDGYGKLLSSWPALGIPA